MKKISFLMTIAFVFLVFEVAPARTERYLVSPRLPEGATVTGVLVYVDRRGGESVLPFGPWGGTVDVKAGMVLGLGPGGVDLELSFAEVLAIEVQPDGVSGEKWYLKRDALEERASWRPRGKVRTLALISGETVDFFGTAPFTDSRIRKILWTNPDGHVASVGFDEIFFLETEWWPDLFTSGATGPGEMPTVVVSRRADRMFPEDPRWTVPQNLIAGQRIRVGILPSNGEGKIRTSGSRPLEGEVVVGDRDSLTLRVDDRHVVVPVRDLEYLEVNGGSSRNTGMGGFLGLVAGLLVVSQFDFSDGGYGYGEALAQTGIILSSMLCGFAWGATETWDFWVEVPLTDQTEHGPDPGEVESVGPVATSASDAR